MKRYRLKKPTTNPDGSSGFVHQGVVALTDDARGADRYLALRRQGLCLERLPDPEGQPE